jgi:hypothetical protein
MKKNPKDVIAGVYHVLKPGGRFVAEFGGYLNCAGKNLDMASGMECWQTVLGFVKTAMGKYVAGCCRSFIRGVCWCGCCNTDLDSFL